MSKQVDGTATVHIAETKIVRQQRIKNINCTLRFNETRTLTNKREDTYDKTNERTNLFSKVAARTRRGGEGRTRRANFRKFN